MFDDYFKAKRILVTGTTGFKGAWLTLWLAEMGAEVAGIGLPPDTQPNLFTAARVEQTGRHHLGDIRDYGFVQSVLADYRPHLVMHLAAQALVGNSYADPLYTWQTNVMGTANLIQACRGLDSLAAVLIVTSDKCYEPLSQARPLTEEDRLGGRDPYSASKACAELAASSFAASFARELPPLATARAGNVLGGGDFAKDRLAPDCVRALVADEPIVLRNPEYVRPWQYVLEPLAGYLELCRRMGRGEAAFAGHGTWNFAPDTGAQIPVRELAQKIIALWGKGTCLVRQDAFAHKETASLLLDNSKARRELGWRPILNIQDSLALTVEWYKAFFGGADARELCLEQIGRYLDKAASAGLSWAG